MTVDDDCDILFKRLVTNGVDFVLIGGFAGVVHGYTYVTQDIDICCDFSTANLFALQRAIADLDPVHRMTPKRQKLKLLEDDFSGVEYGTHLTAHFVKGLL